MDIKEQIKNSFRLTKYSKDDIPSPVWYILKNTQYGDWTKEFSNVYNIEGCDALLSSNTPGIAFNMQYPTVVERKGKLFVMCYIRTVRIDKPNFSEILMQFVDDDKEQAFLTFSEISKYSRCPYKLKSVYGQYLRGTGMPVFFKNSRMFDSVYNELEFIRSQIGIQCMQTYDTAIQHEYVERFGQYFSARYNSNMDVVLTPIVSKKPDGERYVWHISLTLAAAARYLAQLSDRPRIKEYRKYLISKFAQKIHDWWTDRNQDIVTVDKYLMVDNVNSYEQFDIVETRYADNLDKVAEKTTDMLISRVCAEPVLAGIQVHEAEFPEQ